MLLAPSPELAARLRTFVRGRVADPHTADDVVQEVLLRVHARAGQVRDPGAFEAWAFRVARNAVVDHLRARPPELLVDDLAAFERPAATGEPEGDALAQLARCLPELVRLLAPVDAEALELCDLGGLSQTEAAARLGLTVPGMKARVQRARRRLRATILACCDVELDARGGVLAYEPPAECRCPVGPAEGD